MSDKFWYNDIEILFRKDRLTEFFPSKFQTFEEKVNALSRFIIYSCVIIGFYRNDSYYLIVCISLLLSLILLTKYYKKKYDNDAIIKHMFPTKTLLIDQNCTKPTRDNPFANVTINDDRLRKSACPVEQVEPIVNKIYNSNIPNDITDPYKKNNGYQRFYSMPNTQIPNDQTAFATWLYGNGAGERGVKYCINGTRNVQQGC